MKPIFLILFLTSLQLKSMAQSKVDFLFRKSYKARIGYICEETPIPNPCAGYEVFMVISFYNEYLLITEKEISTCGDEYVIHESFYNWNINHDKDLEIVKKNEETQYEFLRNLKITIQNEKIIGHKKRWNNSIDTLRFEPF